MTLSSPERIYICLCLQVIITSIQFENDSKLVLVPAGPLYFCFTHFRFIPGFRLSHGRNPGTPTWQVLISSLSIPHPTTQSPSLELAKISSGKVGPNAEFICWASLSSRAQPGHSSLLGQFSNALKQIFLYFHQLSSLSSASDQSKFTVTRQLYRSAPFRGGGDVNNNLHYFLIKPFYYESYTFHCQNFR